MIRYLPWLFLLACPLMMVFMMRSMGGGGRTMGHGMRRNGRDGVPLDSGVETAPDAMPPMGDEQARIAQLEHEVARLRAVRDHTPGDIQVRRR